MNQTAQNGALADRKPYDLDRVVRLVLGVATFVLLFLLVRYLADVLIPFAVAILLAYVLNPLVGTIESKLKHRGASVLVTVFGVGLVILVVVVTILFMVQQELAGLHRMLEKLSQPDSVLRQNLSKFVQSIHTERTKNIIESFQIYLTEEGVEERIALWLKESLPTALGAATNFVTGIIGFLLALTGFVVVMIYLVFLLIDYRKFSRMWPGLIPINFRSNIVEFVDAFSEAMSRYFRGQVIVAMMMGVLFAVGFVLLGLRMAVLLGLFIGALNMVPYLQTIGFVPAIILAIIRSLEMSESLWWTIGGVLLVFVVCQLLQDLIIVPKVMGKTTGLSPVAILLGIFIWGKLLGFLGLILAIPFTCMGIAYYRRFVLGHKVQYLSGMPPEIEMGTGTKKGSDPKKTNDPTNANDTKKGNGT